MSEAAESNSGRNTSEVLQAAEARRSERIAALREAEQTSNAQESAIIVESEELPFRFSCRKRRSMATGYSFLWRSSQTELRNPHWL